MNIMMRENILIRGEIIRYQEQLRDFRISFQKLTYITPSEPSIRDWCKDVANKLMEEQLLSKHVFRLKKLPYRELGKQYLYKKTNLKRYSKYILAIFLLKYGNYQHLSEYLTLSS